MRSSTPCSLALDSTLLLRSQCCLSCLCRGLYMHDPDVQKVVSDGIMKGLRVRVGMPGPRQLWLITTKMLLGCAMQGIQHLLYAAACAPNS